jgi:hypothetical protein
VPPDNPPAPKPIPAVAVITAQVRIPAGSPLIAYSTQSASSVPVLWNLTSPREPFEVWSQPGHPNGLFLIQHPTPGTTYKIAQLAFGNVDPRYAFDSIEVTVDPSPSPQPPPGPAPAPIPIPPVPPPPDPPVQLGQNWHATLVINTLAPPSELAAVSPLADSVTVGQAVKAMGGTYHWLDTNSAEYAHSNFGSFLPLEDSTGKKVSTPALVIQASSGKILRKVAAPANEAAMIDYLKSLKGAN